MTDFRLFLLLILADVCLFVFRVVLDVDIVTPMYVLVPCRVTKAAFPLSLTLARSQQWFNVLLLLYIYLVFASISNPNDLFTNASVTFEDTY